MQVTIDLPDQVARRLEGQKEQLADIIERGLQQKGDGTSPHWREIIQFLASGPRPVDIVAFRPSEATVERSRELLSKNRESQLTEAEEAELDEMEHVNNLMLLLKTEARRILAARRRL
jgi:hypothetical protein